MRDKYGTKVVQWHRGWHGKRVGQWLPRRGEKMLKIVGVKHWLRVQWLPREGYWVVSSGEVGMPDDKPFYFNPRYEGDAMKRRQAARPGDTVLPALSSASTHWPKLPAIREFISATKYDDGTPRTPGYVTVRNRLTTYEVTIYDPDGAARLSTRAPTLDAALSLMEQLLGVEEAPWEHDRYLADQQAKSKPRKKGA